MPHPSRRTLLLSALLSATSVHVWANPAAQSPATDERRQALDRFIAKKKFVKEPFYLVDLNEADRLRYEAGVNRLARSLRQLPPSRQTKPVVLGMFGPVMKKFESAEGEDQDRFVGYLEELMDIFGIGSSDGLLSTWRHGADTTDLREARNAEAMGAMTPDERSLLERLQSMNRTNAEETLRALFGMPVVADETGQMWSMTATDRSSTLTLVERWGSFTFLWQAAGRFTYARRL